MGQLGDHLSINNQSVDCILVDPLIVFHTVSNTLHQAAPYKVWPVPDMFALKDALNLELLVAVDNIWQGWNKRSVTEAVGGRCPQLQLGDVEFRVGVPPCRQSQTVCVRHRQEGTDLEWPKPIQQEFSQRLWHMQAQQPV